jgi:hypothetical protein
MAVDLAAEEGCGLGPCRISRPDRTKRFHVELDALPRRLFNLRQKSLRQSLVVERPDEAIGDLAVAVDDEGFGHAIDAEVDRGPAVGVGADCRIRIALLAQKLAHVGGAVLIGEANESHPERLESPISGDPHQDRMLLAAWDAPGGEDIDDGHMVLAQIRVGETVGALQPLDPRQGKGRDRLADERRGQARRIAGKQPQEKQRRDRAEDE